jgi:hypothetical protein
MKKIAPQLITECRDTFRNEKVMTIEQLQTLMHCSTTSVRRFLKSWKTFTSYNKNGRFYTLPDVPQFNENGLWWYHHIYFTKHRNLRNTIKYLVTRSDMGMSSREIGRVVGLDPSSFMHHFRDSEGIKREKIQRTYIYFSADPAVLNRQKQRFQEHVQTRLSMPTDAEAVSLLVQFIKHPLAGSEELSAILSREGIYLGPDVVRNFLAHHDLLKKTADTEP